MNMFSGKVEIWTECCSSSTETCLLNWKCLLISIYSLKALNLTVVTHRPDIINYGSLRPNQHEANLNNAFNVAEESLGIAKLLDAEGMRTFFMVTHFNIFLSDPHHI